MDHIAVKEYVLVYFHTLTSEYNHLDSDFLKKLYDVVDVKYKRNLKAVYFVHPTFRSKVSTWFFTTFSVSGLKDKIHHVDSLHQLFSAISPEQIDFPPFVLEYDARENGPYYTSYPPSPDLWPTIFQRFLVPRMPLQPWIAAYWSDVCFCSTDPESFLSPPLWYFFIDYIFSGT